MCTLLVSLVMRKSEHNWQHKANLKLPAFALWHRTRTNFFGRRGVGEETVNFVIYGPSTELHSLAFWGVNFWGVNFNLRNFKH